MSENKKTFRRFNKRPKSQTTEDKIKGFILRNSKNGYFTRISTLSHKFEIPEGKAWEIVGILLSDGIIESDHDTRSGEMRLCETGKTYEILSQENKRKIQKSKKFKKKKHKE